MKEEIGLLAGLREGPPDPLAGPGLHEQAVRIVQLGPEIVGRLAVVLAVEEHRGQGRDAHAR